MEHLQTTSDIVQTLALAFAGFASVLAIVGAFRAGVIGKLRVGSFEISVPEKERVENAIRAAVDESSNTTIPFEVEQLTNYYAQILTQSKISFWFSLVFASLGFVAILLAAFLFTSATQGATIAQFVAGIIMEAVSSLFFVQSRNAQKSMGDFFDKLRLDRSQLESRKLCHEIESSEARDAVRVHLSLHYAGLQAADRVGQVIIDGRKASGQRDT